MIVWEDKFSTGVPELDKQHKNLFQYTNDLESLINDEAGSKDLIDRTMFFIERYIEVHFGHEESCMFKHQCPVAEKNKEAHEKFIQKFKATQVKLKEEGDNDKILREFHHFLEKWLVEHIGKIDTKLKSCVH